MYVVFATNGERAADGGFARVKDSGAWQQSNAGAVCQRRTSPVLRGKTGNARTLADELADEVLRVNENRPGRPAKDWSRGLERSENEPVARFQWEQASFSLPRNRIRSRQGSTDSCCAITRSALRAALTLARAAIGESLSRLSNLRPPGYECVKTTRQCMTQNDKSTFYQPFSMTLVPMQDTMRH